MTDSKTHCGYVVIAGRPNVGKSTLLNRITGVGAAPVSHVPQTTRLPVRGIWTSGPNQLVFVDLPGYSKPKTLLGDRLNRTVRREVASADIVLLLSDASTGVGKGDRFMLERVCDWGVPVICAVNKTDRAGKAKTAKALSDLGAIADDLASSGFPGFAEYFPISAVTGEGVPALISGLAEISPEGPFLFDAGTKVDSGFAGLEGQVAEIVRAKLIETAREELPYSIAVIVDEISEREGRSLIDVVARALVERDSQKGILIGKGGEGIKAAGSSARSALEELLGGQVNLDLRVVVQRDWQRDPKVLDRLGY